MASPIAQIKAKINLINEAQLVTKLAKIGGRYRGCCPFHEEQTPSFYVTPTHFNCFGCGARGDAIDFLQKVHKLSISEVISTFGDGAKSKQGFSDKVVPFKKQNRFEVRLQECRSRLPMHLLWIQLLSNMSPSIKKDLAPRIAKAKATNIELEAIRIMLELPKSTVGAYESLIAYELLCDQWDGFE